MITHILSLSLSAVGMGSSLLPAAITVAFASYVLVGIDEIGLEIEMPFNLLPMFDLCTAMQNEVARQVQYYDELSMLPMPRDME
jgi:predicted membrane chloride channel (bestrophin family)